MAIVIWGNQLTVSHHSALREFPNAPIILIESARMCTKFRYHKQKLLFILTAMREYGDELRSSGRTVQYVTHEDALANGDKNWFSTLDRLIRTQRITTIAVMRPNDRAPYSKLLTWCKNHAISLETTPNTLFLTSTPQFNDWAGSQKIYRMEQFYRWQRTRLNILIDDNGKPEGGKWNYDAENRKPLPKNYTSPPIKFPNSSRHHEDVLHTINDHYADHPGSVDAVWLPTTRASAKAWLNDFITNRFDKFGEYEDAMRAGETFINHSALSSLLNIGLLHPSEVIDAALEANVPLASKEGFVRQVIGWREFMFGMYNFKPVNWIDSNFLTQTKPLEDWWWQLDETDQNCVEPPIIDCLKRLKQYGYSHHIERLMVLGNYMLLSGYDPKQIYNWFMTMYVDAYEWVMVPNVIGMSQFADGGLDHGGFATKPYISGSNYVQKMGKWWPTDAASKQSQWTPMYWKFLEHHHKTLANNYRLRPLLKRFEK